MRLKVLNVVLFVSLILGVIGMNVFNIVIKQKFDQVKAGLVGKNKSGKSAESNNEDEEDSREENKEDKEAKEDVLEKDFEKFYYQLERLCVNKQLVTLTKTEFRYTDLYFSFFPTKNSPPPKYS